MVSSFKIIVSLKDWNGQRLLHSAQSYHLPPPDFAIADSGG